MDLIELDREKHMTLQRTIHAVIRKGDDFGYVAECHGFPIVTLGDTVDETIFNLQEAVNLFIEDEDLADIFRRTN